MLICQIVNLKLSTQTILLALLLHEHFIAYFIYYMYKIYLDYSCKYIINDIKKKVVISLIKIFLM